MEATAKILEAIGDGIDAGRLIDWQAVGRGELLRTLQEVAAIRNRLDGLFTVLLAAADVTGLAHACGNRSLAYLLAEHTRLPLRTARDLVRVATATNPDPDTGCADYPYLGELLRHGELGATDTALIVRTLDQLPQQVRADSEDTVCREIRGLDAAGLRNHCHQLKAEHCAPVVPMPRRNSFGYRIDDDGSITGRFYFSAEAAMILRTALDGLAKPRPATNGVKDARSTAQRNGDALIELCRLAMTEAKLPAHGGSRPNLLLTITLADLRADQATAISGAGAAEPIRLDDDSGRNQQADPPARHNEGRQSDRTSQRKPPEPRPSGPSKAPVRNIRDHKDPDQPAEAARDGHRTVRQLDGTELAVGQLRRYACDCTLIPAVLNADGVPLDLGRCRRTANPYQRKALALRDRGCAWPGCSEPVARCDAHHIRPWWAGGKTDLSNLLLLCQHHHTASHETGWHIFIDQETGKPRFDPPTWWTAPGTRAA